MDTSTLAGLQIAFERCCQVGRDTNKEHFCLLGLDGQVLAERTGEEDHVYLDGFFNAQGKYGVHNHNKPYPISLPDILCATQTKTTIYAVTLNGDKYWSSGLNLDLSSWEDSIRALNLQSTASSLQNQGIGYLKGKLLGIDEDTATQVVVHHFNLGLQRSKFALDYHFELTPETAALYSKVEFILNPQ